MLVLFSDVFAKSYQTLTWQSRAGQSDAVEYVMHPGTMIYIHKPLLLEITLTWVRKIIVHTDACIHM